MSEASRQLGQGSCRLLSDEKLTIALDSILNPCSETAQPSNLTDAAFDDVTRLLHHAGKEEWSLRPRTFVVLKIINLVDLMGSFVEDDLFDIALPYLFNSLPQSFTPSQRHRFLETQNLVLTKAAKIEGGPGSTHAHFDNADTHLESIEQLGKGGSGSVDRVRSKLSHKSYVRKRLARSEMFQTDKKALKTFKNEVESLKRYKHQHLVRYVGSYTDLKWVGILMEPVAECDLFVFLTRKEYSVADYICIRQAFGCLCSAILYLQEQKCRHRDIKPQNILVKNGKVFITDFGIARNYTEKGRSTTTGAPGAYSVDYASPEVVDHLPRNSSSDIWSLGCVFLDMVTVLKGHSLATKIEFFETAGTGSSNPRTNYDIYKRFVDYLRSVQDSAPLAWVQDMIRIDPKTRITAQLLMAHITEYDDGKHYYGLCCEENEESVPTVLMESEVEDISSSEDDDSVDNGNQKVHLDPAIVEKRLCKAARSGDITTIRRSLQKFLRISKKKGESACKLETSSLYFAAGSGNLAICEVLIAFGCDIEAGYQNVPPLLAAIGSTQEEVIDLLIKNLASPNARDFAGRTSLHAAILQEMFHSMQTLIKAGALVDAKDGKETSCLHYACSQVDTTAAKILLDNNAKVDVLCMGMTPLNVAVQRGNSSMVVLLLEFGAKIDGIEGLYHLTPLETAVKNQQPEIAQLLLQHGANVNLTHTQGKVGPPLHYAVHQGYVQLVEVIVKWSPEMELRDGNNHTPLIVSLFQPNLEITRILLKAGADVNAMGDNGAPTLSSALSLKRPDLAQLLIDYNFDVDQPFKYHQSSISYISAAATSGFENDVILLLKNKVNVNVTDAEGNTPLMMAAGRGHSKIVKLLIDHGAHIEAVNRWKQTALHLCATRHCTSITMSLLLDNDIDVDVVDSKGITPLMIAAQNDHPGIMKTLLARGANPNKACHERFTSLHRAAAYVDSSETMALLLDNNAKVDDMMDPYGDTPLMSALKADHIHNVQALLARGADPNHKLEDGNTYLHHAARFGLTKMVVLLLENGADPNLYTDDSCTPYMLSLENGHADIAGILEKLTIPFPSTTLFRDSSTTSQQTSEVEIEEIELFNPSPDALNARDQIGNTPLWNAVDCCDEVAVQTLCNRGSDVNLCTFKGKLPLVSAANKGYIKIVQKLLKHGANPDAMDESGLGALHASTCSEISAALIDADCFINLRSSKGLEKTPLCFAIMEGSDAMVRILLDRGADITMPVDLTNKSPLVLAINYHRPKIVKLLIKHGCDVNPVADPQLAGVLATPLMSAVFSSRSVELINILVDNNARLEERCLGDETPIEAAARLNLKPAFDTLLKRDAKIDGFNKYRLDPLMRMVKAYATSSVKMLLEAGAVCNTLRPAGSCDTALHIAAANSNRPAIMELLFKHGAVTDLKNSEGHTPLFLAALNNCNAMVKCLIKHGADINTRDNNGHTALMSCVIKSKGPHVEMLLNNGSDVHSIHSESGMQAIHIAAGLPSTRIMSLLLERGADVNRLDNQNRSAWDIATTAGNTIMLELFLQASGETKLRVRINPSPK